eukprot:Awhi_evm2s7194
MYSLVVASLIAVTAASNAKSKVDNILNNVEQSEYKYDDSGRYSGPPLRSMKHNGLTSPGCLAKFFWESMHPTFDNDQDEFVPAGRQKYIHPSGNVGSVTYTSVGDHGFTGMFLGNDNCIVRLSLAADPAAAAFTPGMALKCFTENDTPSANMIAMYSLSGQKKNTNFFENSFSNLVGEPTGFLKVIAKKFGLYSACPIKLSLVQMAKIDKDGIAVDDPKYPKQVKLVPTDNVRMLMISESETDFRKDLRELIYPGVELWKVVALVNGTPQQIGSIKLTSYLRASSYGDEELFFQHTRGDYDECPEEEL